MRSALGRWRKALAGVLGLDEILLVAALGCVARGMGEVWAPGAWLVPGVVLLWIALPARAPFVTRPPDAKKGRGE